MMHFASDEPSDNDYDYDSELIKRAVTNVVEAFYMNLNSNNECITSLEHKRAEEMAVGMAKVLKKAYDESTSSNHEVYSMNANGMSEQGFARFTENLKSEFNRSRA